MDHKGYNDFNAISLSNSLKALILRDRCSIQEYINDLCRKDHDCYDSEDEDDLKDSIHLTRDRLYRKKETPQIDDSAKKEIIISEGYTLDINLGDRHKIVSPKGEREILLQGNLPKIASRSDTNTWNLEEAITSGENVICEVFNKESNENDPAFFI